MSGETCKAAEIDSPHQFWSVGRVLEKEMIIENQAKDSWRFETEVFSNGYKILQFLKRAVKQSSGR